MVKKIYITHLLVMLSLLPFFSIEASAEDSVELSRGQIIYVPAYSHIYHGNSERPFLLAVTISIRNIDLKYKMRIKLVDYYETQGHLLKHFIEKPVVLKPLESLRYIIPENDKSGGSGANFIVQWESDQLMNPPITECIMIGTQTQQGISFTSRGKVIQSTEE